MNKAEKIAKSEKIEEFKSSSGWLQKFKKRHKLKMKNIMGEEMSARVVDEKVLDDFKSILSEKIEKYGPSNIYNGDETGLFFKQMPIKSLCTTVRKGFKNF